MFMIKSGGRVTRSGHTYGIGLFGHYKRMWELVWPEEEVDPWAELALHSFCANKITVLIGPQNCSKTNNMAKFALCDWWCFPKDTLWLVSSTTIPEAQGRIWGRVKSLFNRAKRRWPQLPGKPVEYLNSILNDDVKEESLNLATELDKGIVLVPCKRGKGFTGGISSFIGRKAPRLRHAGDEVQFMPSNWLGAYSNFTGEEKDFKGVMSGNPIELLDSLCMAARPKEGWEAFADTGLTQEWTSAFFGAHVINYDGRDSPNNRFPCPPARFKHLITARDVASIASSNGPDHPMTHMQAYGKPNRMLARNRVITQLICEQGNAFDIAVWKGGGRKMLYGLDPAYGGGDDCVGIPVEFGEDIDNRMILKIYSPEVIPISVSLPKEVDDQIAEYIQSRLKQLNIPPNYCFYGAFGKGTLGYAFSKIFGAVCPVPIDEGGSPTKRAVRDGLFVTEQDGRKRLMRCDEYYDRRISQLWYDTRLCAESGQMRELPKEVLEDGCLRTFKLVKGNKVSVETKEDLKIRMLGESPNKFDALTFGVAGAILNGFKIAKLGSDKGEVSLTDKYKVFQEMEDERWKLKRSKMLHVLH